MSFRGDSPSSVMYDDFKELGISHVRAAETLFDVDYSFGGKPLAERLRVRTQLSRYFVRVEPGTISRALFADFDISIQKLAVGLLGTSGLDVQALERHYRDEAAVRMQRSLSAFGIDPAPYRNALHRIGAEAFSNVNDRYMLALLLFTATGCLGDPRKAVTEVDSFAQRRLGSIAHTVEARETSGQPVVSASSPADDLPIGIVRIFDGMSMKAEYALHPLPLDRPATIGSGDCDITDVDEHVSRRHARIWRDGKRWFIEGLGSTNGTTLISGKDASVSVVEPPRSQRKTGWRAEAHQIRPSDTICLGDTTRYAVRRIST